MTALPVTSRLLRATIRCNVPRNATDVPGDALFSRAGGGTGQQRSERLRARRDEAGMAQVSGWVPKDRRPYAREVLAALARGANSLPPDPEQITALEAAKADAVASRAAEMEARAALVKAERRGQALVAELDTVRAEAEAARETKRQAEMAAATRVEAAERAREAIAGELRAAEAATAQAQAEAERFQKAPGLRGLVARWLIRL